MKIEVKEVGRISEFKYYFHLWVNGDTVTYKTVGSGGEYLPVN